MKLVDILALELKVWPEGYTSLQQSFAGMVFHGAKDGILPIERLSVSEDFRTASVTRAQWQAAVDALKAESAPAWAGIGLPPVGTVCEAKTTRGWSRGTIIAHGLPPKENIAVWQEDGERISLGVKEYFRQIRTPEQIAAEEREIAIRNMLHEPGVTTDHSVADFTCAALYDAGYRKFEIVDN
ncbi:MAG: hypothetical protein J6D44_12635 [Pseudomonas sp.]|nr:hypothetical protein [Pseudomonas sp.]